MHTRARWGQQTCAACASSFFAGVGSGLQGHFIREDVDEARVPHPGVRLVVHDAKRAVSRQGPAVGPVRGEGVVDVGDGQTAEGKGHLLGRQAIGIATTIEPLVMAPDEAEERSHRAEGLADLETDGGMKLHDLVFLGAELSGLVQVLEGNADLSDVVEKPGAAEVSPFPTVEADGRTQGFGDVGHALGVSPRVVVFGLESRGQAHEDVLRLLQLVHEGLGPKEVPRAGHELLGIHRLRQEVVASCSDALDAILPGHEPGDENDGNEVRPLVGLQATAGVEPREARHRHIHEDEVGRLGQGLLHGFLSVAGRVEEVSFCFEETHEDITVLGKVVHDEDPTLSVHMRNLTWHSTTP